MLYLNFKWKILLKILFIYLTLTSVVFEWEDEVDEASIIAYLTLTSVVFEFDDLFKTKKSVQFNFNKCCIWIKFPP